MNIHKFIITLCFNIFIISNATINANAGQSETEKAAPSGIQIAKVLLKNGNYIEDSCDTVTDGRTLKDKLISLVFPESSNEQIIVTYHCLDDKRETRDIHQLVPVWNCSITGQVMEKETDQKPPEGNIENLVTPATIVIYLDKKNLKIIDLLCF